MNIVLQVVCSKCHRSEALWIHNCLRFAESSELIGTPYRRLHDRQWSLVIKFRRSEIVLCTWDYLRNHDYLYLKRKRFFINRVKVHVYICDINIIFLFILSFSSDTLVQWILRLVCIVFSGRFAKPGWDIKNAFIGFSLITYVDVQWPQWEVDFCRYHEMASDQQKLFKVIFSSIQLIVNNLY